MFSIEYILTQLYPKRDQKKIKEMQEKGIFGFYISEYDSSSWQEVKKEDLVKEEVQARLIRTMFLSQHQYYGVMNEILISLEEWSNSTMVFEDFDEELIEFYQLFYCFLGYTIVHSKLVELFKLITN